MRNDSLAACGSICKALPIRNTGGPCSLIDAPEAVVGWRPAMF